MKKVHSLEHDLSVTFNGKTYSFRNGKLKYCGDGGEGIVYRVIGAKDYLGRDVVVKVFNVTKKTEETKERRYQRFREATLAVCKLQQEPGFRKPDGYFPIVEILGDANLPETYEEVRKGNLAYFFMPKLEPWDRKKNPSVQYKVRALTQVLESIQSLHGYKMTHRDIKAGNILRDADGKWKLSDFGMICFERPNRNLTNTGDCLKIYGGPDELGSVARYNNYKDKFDVFSKSDIYLFGKLCWQIISGSDSFFRVKISFLIIRQNVFSKQYPAVFLSCPFLISYLKR